MERGWGLFVLFRFTFSYLTHYLPQVVSARDVNNKYLVSVVLPLPTYLPSILLSTLKCIPKRCLISPSSLLLFPRTDQRFSTWELVHPFSWLTKIFVGFSARLLLHFSNCIHTIHLIHSSCKFPWTMGEVLVGLAVVGCVRWLRQVVILFSYFRPENRNQAVVTTRSGPFISLLLLSHCIYMQRYRVWGGTLLE